MATADLPQLSVAVVTYNSDLARLRETLRSLRAAVTLALAAEKVESVSICLVDNASAAGYRDELQGVVNEFQGDEHQPLLFCPQPDNLGFGAGHNRAFAALSTADRLELREHYHLILNPDVQLDEHAVVGALETLASEPGTVAVSPYVEGSSGQQEFLCKRYPSVLVLLLRGFAPQFVKTRFSTRLARYEMRDACGHGEPAEVEIVSGCCLLVRAAVFEQIGGFDEDYFLYFEDFDLSLRLQREGHLSYQPAMRIVHHGGYTASKGWRHIGWFIRSGVRFFNTYGWRWL